MFKHKTKLLLGFLSLVVILLSQSEIIVICSAQAAAGQFLKDIGGQDGLRKIAETLSIMNTFLFAGLMIALNMMQFLMQTTFFNDARMMGALNTIWVLSRDLVNIAFALMLVGVAIYTIITADTKYVKEKLVHFVLAVILVNFSWFFPRVIIDVSNVLTATVFSVPQMLPGPFCRSMNSRTGVAEECNVMVDSKIFGDANEMNIWCATAPPHAPPTTICYPHPGFYAWKSQKISTAMNNGMAPAHALMNGLVISFMKITSWPEVASITSAVNAPTGTSADFLAAMNILMTIMMTFVFQIAAILPIIGLAVGYLVRIVILWVCIAFMPFTFIGYAVKGTLTTQLFGFEMDIWKQFVTAAFLPATVGIPIVIGFIMMSSAAQVPMPGNFPQSIGIPLVGGVTTWWSLLWMIAAIGILWNGAFAALKRNDIVGKFTEPMRNLGNTVFKGAMQLPLLTPLPIPGMPAGTNLGTLVNGPRIAAGVIGAATSGRPMDKSLFQQMGETFRGGGGNVDPIHAAEKVQKAQTDRIVEALIQIKAAPNKMAMDLHIDTIKRELVKDGVDAGHLTGQSVLELVEKMGKVTDSKMQESLRDKGPAAASDALQKFKTTS
ncbi:MAG: hypothetical protein PHZ00_02630 [Candidatus Peribacteraceae bacterium]|nr:hypothetical protein [Candidatus Peribacteraceae bacterium]